MIVGVASCNDVIYTTVDKPFLSLVNDEKITKVAMFTIDGPRCINLDMFLNRPSLTHLKRELQRKLKKPCRQEARLVVEYYKKALAELGTAKYHKDFDHYQYALLRFLTEFNARLTESPVVENDLVEDLPPINGVTAREALSELIRRKVLVEFIPKRKG